MANYFVNKEPQPNGDHEVHRENCDRMSRRRIFLGNHFHCEDAIREAKKSYARVNGCYYCAKECHTS